MSGYASSSRKRARTDDASTSHLHAAEVQARKARSAAKGSSVLGNPRRTPNFPWGGHCYVDTSELINIACVPLYPSRRLESTDGISALQPVDLRIQPFAVFQPMCLFGTTLSSGRGNQWTLCARQFGNALPSVFSNGATPLVPYDISPKRPFFQNAVVLDAAVKIRIEQVTIPVYPGHEDPVQFIIGGPIVPFETTDTLPTNNIHTPHRGFWIFAYTPTYSDQTEASSLVSSSVPVFIEAAIQKIISETKASRSSVSITALVSNSGPARVPYAAGIGDAGLQGSDFSADLAYSAQGDLMDWNETAVEGLKMAYIPSVSSMDKLTRVTKKFNLPNTKRWYDFSNDELEEYLQIRGSAAVQTISNFLNPGDAEPGSASLGGPTFTFSPGAFYERLNNTSPVTMFGFIPDFVFPGSSGSLAAGRFQSARADVTPPMFELKIEYTRKVLMYNPRDFTQVDTH